MKDNINSINEELKGDCKHCFGFCCVALYFSKSEGFPNDKEAGRPCINLQNDFKCSVHKELRNKGLKGCSAYDCFGAGQKVARDIYGERNWINNPELAKEMFKVFLIIRQLHEMLWYLTEAFRLQSRNVLREEINEIINETIRLTNLDINSILDLDLLQHRLKVNNLLLKTSELIRKKAYRNNKNKLKNKRKIGGRLNLMGANLKKIDLIGEDLSGALLIASDLRGVDLSCADLIGADLRDADIRGANLRDSIFITQHQINSAKGSYDTQLPSSLVRPIYWER